MSELTPFADITRNQRFWREVAKIIEFAFDETAARAEMVKLGRKFSRDEEQLITTGVIQPRPLRSHDHPRPLLTKRQQRNRDAAAQSTLTHSAH